MPSVEYVPAARLAQAWSVSVRTVHRWGQLGMIPREHPAGNRTVRYPASLLEQGPPTTHTPAAGEE